MLAVYLLKNSLEKATLTHPDMDTPIERQTYKLLSPQPPAPPQSRPPPI